MDYAILYCHDEVAPEIVSLPDRFAAHERGERGDTMTRYKSS